MNLEQEMCMSQLSFQITEPSALNVIVESLKLVRESSAFTLASASVNAEAVQ